MGERATAVDLVDVLFNNGCQCSPVLPDAAFGADCPRCVHRAIRTAEAAARRETLQACIKVALDAALAQEEIDREARLPELLETEKSRNEWRHRCRKAEKELGRLRTVRADLYQTLVNVARVARKHGAVLACDFTLPETEAEVEAAEIIDTLRDENRRLREALEAIVLGDWLSYQTPGKVVSRGKIQQARELLDELKD